MRPGRAGIRLLGLALLTAAGAAASGCIGFLHPVHSEPDVVAACKPLPKCCRDHVYVFLMNGLDPVNYGNLTGLCDYIQDLGFCKTYYGQLYHLWQFKHEIRKIHEQDPDAHFVLVGFSLGCNYVHSLAESVAKDDIKIDLIVWLSGNHPVEPMPHHKPDNVCRVVNMLASGLMWTRGERDWAENQRLEHTLHFGAPTHPQTLAMLSRELCAIASTVPVVEPPVPPAPANPEQAPPPRPVKVFKTAQRDEWDFLKPVSTLTRFPETDVQPVDAPVEMK